MQPNTNTNNERERTASAIPRKFLARICATSGTLPNLSVLWLVCLHQDLRRWHQPTLMVWCSNIAAAAAPAPTPRRSTSAERACAQSTAPYSQVTPLRPENSKVKVMSWCATHLTGQLRLVLTAIKMPRSHKGKSITSIPQLTTCHKHQDRKIETLAIKCRLNQITTALV